MEVQEGNVAVGTVRVVHIGDKSLDVLVKEGKAFLIQREILTLVSKVAAQRDEITALKRELLIARGDIEQGAKKDA
jgi:hypothetical protein